jgi:hypothetical protein
VDVPKSIEYDPWWRPGGGMMYRRDCLGPDHPENLYNHIKRTCYVDPEWYGIKNPASCPCCHGTGRSEAVNENPSCGFR